MSKEADLKNELELAISFARKAQFKVTKFYESLQNKENYQILLAPFYYKVGSALANYVECNVDEMNNLKPLELPEMEEEDDQVED